MGWFSPVKGAYPGLGQVDKTLPTVAGLTVKRGMIVKLAAGDGSDLQKNGVWDKPSSSNDILYVALQDSTDPTAGFAGTSFDPKGGVPCITALDLNQDAEYETDMFDGADSDIATLASKYTIGKALYANADGLLTDTQGSNTLVGYVTGVPASRWINNAIAVPPGQTDQRLAYRTGATKTVLRFKTK